MARSVHPRVSARRKPCSSRNLCSSGPARPTTSVNDSPVLAARTPPRPLSSASKLPGIIIPSKPRSPSTKDPQTTFYDAAKCPRTYQHLAAASSCPEPTPPFFEHNTHPLNIYPPPSEHITEQRTTDCTYLSFLRF
jgi:hypothetical protein